MEEQKPVSPFCEGIGCPVKGHCARFKTPINKMTELHYESPYNHERKKCEAHLDSLPGGVWFEMQLILKKNRDAEGTTQ